MTTATHPEAGPAGGARRRILQVAGSAAGGVRAHLADCARILAGQGHDVIVQAPAAVLEGLDVGAARAEALEIGPLPSPTDAMAVARLRRLGRRADALHAHGLRAGALAALALGRRRPGRARLVVTLHNLTVGGRAARALGRWLEGIVARRADLVLAVSPDLAERARSRGAAAVELAIIPAPEAGAAQDSSVSSIPPADHDEAWGQGLRILTVARLAPQKGIDLLLEAASILSHRVGVGEMPAFTWAVAGEGPVRVQAQDRIAADGLPIRLLGRRQDAPGLMAASDIVVQTSLWEGQPLTIQEALRSGTAIVATDVGGTALTARGGAVLVPAEAPALAEAIAELLTDDRARAQASGRASRACQSLPTSADLAAQLRRAMSA